MAKIFGSKEEADNYYKYVVVVVRNHGVITGNFRTKKAAERANIVDMGGSGSIMTRRQFNEYKKNNKNLF